MGECRSEVTDDATVVSTSEVLHGKNVNVLAEEANGAVSHDDLHTTGVPAEGFVIWAAVVVHPAAFRRTTERGIVVVWASNSRSRGQGIAGSLQSVAAGIRVGPGVHTAAA